MLDSNETIKERIHMWKKVGITLLLVSALLFGSGFSYANSHSTTHDIEKVYYSTEWKNFDLEALLNKFLKQYENHNKQQVTQSEKKQEQNKTEQPQQAPEEASVQQNPSEQLSKKEQTAESTILSEYELEVVELTNVERQKHGLAPLQIDEALSKVASVKSEDMAKQNYFSHNSPTYGSPFDMMKQFGISYRTAGENIAMGQRSPQEVVNAWMNSEGHRANILNSNFTHIGVGHASNGNYWTQQFIGK